MSLGFLGSGAHRLGIPGMGSAGSTLGSGAGSSFSPTQLGNLAAWYDVANSSSLIYDSSNRVSLLADRSGNSGVNVLALNGAAGNYGYAPSSAALNITGDIDIRAYFSLPTWVPAVFAVPIAKWNGGAGQFSYFMTIDTTGNVRLVVTTDGTTQLTATSSVATGFAAYSANWIRATRATATGNVNFYTSSDGVTWNPLGTQQTTTAGAHFSSTSILTIGCQTTAAFLTQCNVYRAQILNGIAGTVVFDANFATAAKLATSFTESSANAATVTINTTGDLGARICGARDLVNLTAANQPVYLAYAGSKYAYLNGVSGNYLSTPNAVPLQITGDIDLRCLVNLTNWTPAADVPLIAKDDNTGTQASYVLRIDNTTGKLHFFSSSNGSAFAINSVSTLAPTVANGASLWVRATLAVASGTVTFYTSAPTDGVSWTGLGTPVVTSATSIFSSTAPLQIGRQGGTAMATGNIYRAQILNGIAGPIQFDFNPSSYVSGTTLTDASANAAVITINGGATIVTRSCLYFNGTSHYLKSAGFALSQPETVYLVASQSTWIVNKQFMDGSAAGSQMAIYNTTSSPRFSLYAGAVGPENTNLPLQTAGVIGGVFNNASSAIRVNRTASVTGTAGANNANGVTLGASTTPSAWGNITASELALYAAAHDDATQQRMALYEGQKWGLSV